MARLPEQRTEHHGDNFEAARLCPDSLREATNGRKWHASSGVAMEQRIQPIGIVFVLIHGTDSMNDDSKKDICAKEQESAERNQSVGHTDAFPRPDNPVS